MSVEPKIVQIRAKSTKLWARRFSYSFLDGIALKSTPLIIHCCISLVGPHLKITLSMKINQICREGVQIQCICISLVGPDLKISQAIQRFPEASISFKFKKDKEIYLINEDKKSAGKVSRFNVSVR
eukprot:TRINITY_DN4851_c0_g1_i6.p1 TRINITY_DN4851_c0_g1~~TRINITY_DN4851_c0_g1_i6.p1  ORF type:complete len:126 (+),score=8.46 TRINITY_DN4851_c0_g1_i6:1449-1826(+)